MNTCEIFWGNIFIFLFQLFPIVAFFRAFVSVLYYIGVMQVLVAVIGKFLAFCLDTTPAESISTGANIFVSMVCIMLFTKQ